MTDAPLETPDGHLPAPHDDGPEEVEHGTAAAYLDYHCRCNACVAGNTERRDRVNVDLTADEIEALSGEGVAPEIQAYMVQQRQGIGTRTMAYRKIASAARAEADALLAVHELSEMQAELVRLTEAKGQLGRGQRAGLPPGVNG